MRGRPAIPADKKRTERLTTFLSIEENERLNRVVEEKSTTRAAVAYEAVKPILSGGAIGGKHMYPSTSASGIQFTGSLLGADVIQETNLQFSCSWNGEKWEGSIRRVSSFGNHVEFYIESRGSGFSAICGRWTSGVFLCIPGESVCMSLSSPDDLFYNKEVALRLQNVNRIDAVSSVYALKSLFDSGMFP